MSENVQNETTSPSVVTSVGWKLTRPVRCIGHQYKRLRNAWRVLYGRNRSVGDVCLQQVPADTMEQKISELGPWITLIEYGGKIYGGEYDPRSDDRAWQFIESMRSENLAAGSTILECGCLEGGHTVILARAFPQTTIVAVDVREENLRRASLYARISGVSNVRFQQDDLEDPRKTFSGSYAAIFCVGLLYHLREPASFLKRCSSVSPRLWLWTLVCAETLAAEVEKDYRGRFYDEPTHHPLSAVRDLSFIPTLGSLCDMLWNAGFSDIKLIRKEMTANANGPAVLLNASR